MKKRNISRKCYSDVIKIESFEDRFAYLCLCGTVGEITFGGRRFLNQSLYQTSKWKSTRRRIIIRDNGCDLAHEDYPIIGPVYIHHIAPITIDDILEERSCVFDPENLICVSFKTHQAIHYGSKELLPSGLIIREKNDTCPWK